MTDLLDFLVGTIVGLLSSSLFVVGLIAGFCVLVGFLKLRPTTGGASVVRSLDEALTHRPTRYFSPADPRGPADQLRTPELLESASRPS